MWHRQLWIDYLKETDVLELTDGKLAFKSWYQFCIFIIKIFLVPQYRHVIYICEKNRWEKSTFFLFWKKVLLSFSLFLFYMLVFGWKKYLSVINWDIFCIILKLMFCTLRYNWIIKTIWHSSCVINIILGLQPRAL